MYQFAALIEHARCDDHSPVYNVRPPAYSAPEKNRRSSLSFQHTRACSTLCTRWAIDRGSTRDSLLDLAGGAAWSAACRCLSMQVGLRTFERRWRGCCPILEARLRARCGLCSSQWNLLMEISIWRCSPFWCISRAADWSGSITVIDGRRIDQYRECDGLLA